MAWDGVRSKQILHAYLQVTKGAWIRSYGWIRESHVSFQLHSIPAAYQQAVLRESRGWLCALVSNAPILSKSKHAQLPSQSNPHHWAKGA
jgi:hypothetical protein